MSEQINRLKDEYNQLEIKCSELDSEIKSIAAHLLSRRHCLAEFHAKFKAIDRLLAGTFNTTNHSGKWVPYQDE